MYCIYVVYFVLVLVIGACLCANVLYIYAYNNNMMADFVYVRNGYVRSFSTVNSYRMCINSMRLLCVCM